MPTTADGFHIPTAWFHRLGFPLGNPFATHEATREPETALIDYFVLHPAFEAVAGHALQPHSAILEAERGCGKSTALRLLEWQCRADELDAPALAVPYVNFDRPLRHADAAGVVPLSHHVNEILAVGLGRLFDALADRPERAAAFSGGLVEELGHYLRAYTDRLTRIGLDKWLLARGYPSDVDAVALRRGHFPPDNAFLDFVAHLLREPEEPLDLSRQTPVEQYQTFVTQAHRAGFAAVLVLVDRVDEREPLASVPERVAALLQRLATNMTLIDQTEGAALKFFLPPAVGDALRRGPDFRPDRLPSRTITWSNDDLVMMLDKRVRVFSEGALPSLDAISATGGFVPRMAAAAGGSPRNMLRLAGLLFYYHHLRRAVGPPLTTADLERALADFAAQERPAAVAGPPIRIDAGGSVWVWDQVVDLSDKQQKLLAHFLAHESVVCTYDQLMTAIPGKPHA